MLPPSIEEKVPQIRSLIEASGAELVDLSFRHYGLKSFVTVIADKPGGITLDECAAINNRLSPLFDEVVEGSYTLEVNSPGLDRPLRTETDFLRAVGKALRVFYKDTSGRMLDVTGQLRAVNGGRAEIAREKDGEVIAVPIAAVVKAERHIKIQ
jgi:ribosome maturation factor RimP